MNPEQDEKKYSRISKATAVLMVICGVFYALLELSVDWIPVIGQILAFFIDLFSLMHFVMWFMLCRVKLTSPRAAKRFWVSMLSGILPIPIIDIFLVPLGVILTIGSTWKEDAGGAIAQKTNPKKFLGGVKPK